jgi:hypothetical protein
MKKKKKQKRVDIIRDGQILIPDISIGLAKYLEKKFPVQYGGGLIVPTTIQHRKNNYFGIRGTKWKLK